MRAFKKIRLNALIACFLLGCLMTEGLAQDEDSAFDISRVAIQQATRGEDIKPACEENQITVWVMGGVMTQGERLCFDITEPSLKFGPVFMTRVLAKAHGFVPSQGLYDQVFLYDITAHSTKEKIEKRIFDYEEMEFQKFGVLRQKRSREQLISITPGKEYVVFVNTPTDNYWAEFLTRGISSLAALGAIIAAIIVTE